MDQKQKQELAMRLRSIRELSGYRKPEEFARLIGVNPVQYGRYERGVNAPGLDILTKIATAANCSLQWLVTGDGAQNGDCDLWRDTFTAAISGLTARGFSDIGDVVETARSIADAADRGKK